MITQAQLDAISDDGLRQAARQLLLPGYTTMTARSRADATSLLTARMHVIAEVDGRDVAEAVWKAMHPSYTPAENAATLERVLTKHYYRSRAGVIHLPDCSHRPQLEWRLATGMAPEEVNRLMRGYPWLRWCGHCGPTLVTK